MCIRKFFVYWKIWNFILVANYTRVMADVTSYMHRQDFSVVGVCFRHSTNNILFLVYTLQFLHQELPLDLYSVGQWKWGMMSWGYTPYGNCISSSLNKIWKHISSISKRGLTCEIEEGAGMKPYRAEQLNLSTID